MGKETKEGRGEGRKAGKDNSMQSRVLLLLLLLFAMLPLLLLL